MDDETIDDAVLATHEALSNAIDHAFDEQGGVGEVWIRAEWHDAEWVSVVVHDSGRWRPPPADPGTRGHGMTLIAGLSQRSAVHHTDSGTTVEMYWSLGERRRP